MNKHFKKILTLTEIKLDLTVARLPPVLDYVTIILIALPVKTIVHFSCKQSTLLFSYNLW